MTVLKTDPCASIILDFIAGGVIGNFIGESKGNYNAYFANIDSSLDLSAKSFDEIYAFQRWMLSQDKRSTAIGRYQFLKSTLEGLQEEAQYTGSILFTPETQDRLAIRLLEERGYSEWRMKKISDKQFAHNLSIIWASLPDPLNEGKSHYDGDKVGNSASTSLDNVYAMLKHARQAISHPPQPLPLPPLPVPLPVPLPEPPECNSLSIPVELLTNSIKVSQQLLQLAGYYRGDIDGDWRGQTQEAYEGFWSDLRKGQN